MCYDPLRFSLSFSDLFTLKQQHLSNKLHLKKHRLGVKCCFAIIPYGGPAIILQLSSMILQLSCNYPVQWSCSYPAIILQLSSAHHRYNFDSPGDNSSELLSTLGCIAVTSQRSLHNAPIFRLLLKVAVNGTHQCDFLNFCGGSGSQHLDIWSACKSLHGMCLMHATCYTRHATLNCARRRGHLHDFAISGPNCLF